MESLKLKLQAFEGPLDLLLHLIDKGEFEITDIPVSEITDQYMSYLEAMQVLNLEIASEFLVMASNLLAMKSGLLLPRPIELDVPLIDYEDDLIDPRQALMERLIEYKKFKLICEELRQAVGEVRVHRVAPWPGVVAAEHAVPREVGQSRRQRVLRQRGVVGWRRRGRRGLRKSCPRNQYHSH